MLDHAGRYNWHFHQELLRPSVLGRAASKPHMLRNESIKAEADADEAVPSRTTYDHVRAYLNARESGDEWGETDALNKVAESWRADNAAGGLPVHAHLPLPQEFAKTLARLMDGLGETQQQREFDGVVTKLEPSVRTLVAQQLAALMETEEHAHLRTHSAENLRPGIAPELGLRGPVAASAESNSVQHLLTPFRTSSLLRQAGYDTRGAWASITQAASRLEEHAGAEGQDRMEGRSRATQVDNLLGSSASPLQASATVGAQSALGAVSQPQTALRPGSRPSEKDIAGARADAGRLPITGSLEPTPVWYVRDTPDGPLRIVAGDPSSRREDSAERGAPPKGAVLGGHGHIHKPAPSRADLPTKRLYDDYNEAQGYPGPKDYDAVRSTGIPEIVRSHDRIFIIYLDENGNPVAEVVAGKPFPPNVQEIVEKNPHLKKYVGKQKWTFRNGPPAAQ